MALGAYVAAHKLRAHGARAGLPRTFAGEVPEALLPNLDQKPPRDDQEAVSWYRVAAERVS